MENFVGTIELLLKAGMTIEDLITKSKSALNDGINVEMNTEIISYLREKKLLKIKNV
jgi:hypothetical protein